MTWRVLRWAVVTMLVAWSVGPVALALLTSLSTQADVVSAHFVPSRLNLDGYRTLLTHSGSAAGGIESEASDFGRALLNSALETLETTIVLLLIAVTAGYAFSRLRFRGRGVVLGALLITLVIPAFALIVPLFRLMANLNLIDTQPGLVLIYVTGGAPLAVWLFANYCRELPSEPEEAALLDGCSRLGALFKVVLPQMRSGIAALTAIIALSTWGSFLVPLLFAPTLATKPATVLITELVGKYTTNYPLIAAAGILIVIPPAIVAVALNRHIRGMLGGYFG